MQTERTVVVVGTAGLIALVALGLAWLYAPSAGPPIEPRAGVTLRPDPRTIPSVAGAEGASSGSRTRSVRGPGAAPPGAPGAVPGEPAADDPSSSSTVPGAPRRTFESPEAAEAFVSERVLDLFAAVAPEIHPADIEQTCSADGRDCTFTGPWPGDDLLVRWTRAIAEERTGVEAMEGVTFSSFAPVDVDGRREFRIVAHAP